jgi:hypothetical protein
MFGWFAWLYRRWIAPPVLPTPAPPVAPVQTVDPVADCICTLVAEMAEQRHQDQDWTCLVHGHCHWDHQTEVLTREKDTD